MIVAAVKIWTGEAEMLIFSVYVSPLTYHQLSETVTVQK
jgi:hypothetical protein